MTPGTYRFFARDAVPAKIDRSKISATPPPIVSTNSMIAATTGGVSVESGIKVLKEGGTAADAAMTVALAHVVQAAGSYVSFAGIISMLYYDAASGKVYF